MPEIARKGSIKIEINSDEHNPPHTHVYKGGEEVVVVNLIDLTPIYGTTYPKGDKGNIRSLIKDNLEELLNEWEKHNPEARTG